MIMFFNCFPVGVKHLLLLFITITKNIIEGSPSKKHTFLGEFKRSVNKIQITMECIIINFKVIESFIFLSLFGSSTPTKYLCPKKH